MTKTEMKELVRALIDTQDMCRVYFKYDPNYYYFIPFKVSENLFLAAEEDDFIIDGFSIRRFRDVKKVEIKDDMCPKIIKAEGILDGLTPPEVEITDWHSAFVSLKRLGEIIIIERESIDPDESLFAIGRIEKVNKTNLVFSHFDADGVWQDEVYVIPFTQITSVTIGSRYSRFFAKYV